MCLLTAFVALDTVKEPLLSMMYGVTADAISPSSIRYEETNPVTPVKGEPVNAVRAPVVLAMEKADILPKAHPAWRYLPAGSLAAIYGELAVDNDVPTEVSAPVDEVIVLDSSYNIP